MPTSEPSTAEPSTANLTGADPKAPMRVALPNKGALSEEAAELMSEAGYRLGRSGKALRVYDRDESVEFLFLRPRDIAIYVGSGVIDLGITGRDLSSDSRAPVDEVLSLGFGKAEFRLAAPAGSGFALVDGARIATSYDGLLGAYLTKQRVEASIIHLDGAVELAPSLGVADAVADVVQSGRTMADAGLELIGEPLLASEAVLITQRGRKPDEAARVMVERLRGVVVAAEYLMVEYDLPAMVHVSTSCNACFHTTGAHYLNADTTAFMQLIQGDLFKDFPALKFIIPHGGGAVPYHWGRFRGLAQELKKPLLKDHLLNNIFFDTCVYHQPGIDLLTKVIPVDNILFASEMIGAVRGIDPETGFYYDDTKRYIEASRILSSDDKHQIYEGNVRRVFPRLDARLKAKGI